MEFRPNDKTLELNEKRTCTFKLDGAVGSTTLSAPIVTCPEMTVGAPSISGKSVIVALTAGRTGTHMVRVQATLSNGDIVAGVARFKVIDSTLETNQDCDYAGRC